MKNFLCLTVLTAALWSWSLWLNSWVLCRLWSWFVCPVFELPALAQGEMAGLYMVFVHLRVPREVQKSTYREELVRAAVSGTAGCLISLTVGYCLKGVVS